MKELIEAISPIWFKRPGVHASELLAFEAAIGRKLPDDYKTFMQWSNGGEGSFGDAYLSLWRVDELLSLNEGYAIWRYIPECFGVGSDGGSRCYVFDYRGGYSEPTLGLVPFGDLGSESLVTLGPSLTQVLDKWLG